MESLNLFDEEGFLLFELFLLWMHEREKSHEIELNKRKMVRKENPPERSFWKFSRKTMSAC